MKVEHHKKFKKHYKQRIAPYPGLRKKWEERAELFLRDPRNPLLRDHALEGMKVNYRAFSITGDIRAIYRVIGNTLRFIDIGTHNQVY